MPVHIAIIDMAFKSASSASAGPAMASIAVRIVARGKNPMLVKLRSIHSLMPSKNNANI
jgi:hypothetical protein